MTQEQLEERLKKAGIDPDVFAELVWNKISPKIESMMRLSFDRTATIMAGKVRCLLSERDENRKAYFVATLTNLLAAWFDGEEALIVADQVNAIVESVRITMDGKAKR